METPQTEESKSKHFHVFKTGALTVIGFEAKHLSDQTSMLDCRDSLFKIVEQDCQILVVDLMDVEVVSSWILGVLAAIKQRGVEVLLYHPASEMRKVLHITHLEDLLATREW